MAPGNTFQLFSGAYEPQADEDLDDMVAVANRIEQDELREAERERDTEPGRVEPAVVVVEEYQAEGMAEQQQSTRLQDTRSKSVLRRSKTTVQSRPGSGNIGAAT